MRWVDSTVQRLKTALQGRVDRIALFGSAIYRSASDVSDVDVVLFVEPARFEEVRSHVCSLDLGRRLKVEPVMGNYSELPESGDNDADGSLPLHVAFLPTDLRQCKQTELFQRNRRMMRFV